MLGLVATQIDGQLLLQPDIDFIEEVHHHDVLRRNRAVGLQLEQPESLRTLQPDQGIACRRNRTLQRLGTVGVRQPADVGGSAGVGAGPSRARRESRSVEGPAVTARFPGPAGAADRPHPGHPVR